MGLESSFQNSVLNYLNSIPRCKAENVSGNASQSGRPDINGCFHGRMFKLKAKARTETLVQLWLCSWGHI